MKSKSMRQLNTALFALFALVVLFAAAFAYDYFRALEETTPSSLLDADTTAERSERLRRIRELDARSEVLAPAIESAERVDSVLRNNRSGLLDSAMPEKAPVRNFDPLSVVE